MGVKSERLEMLMELLLSDNEEMRKILRITVVDNMSEQPCLPWLAQSGTECEKKFQSGLEDTIESSIIEGVPLLSWQTVKW